ncbi:hypothetical protein DL98DRAFT_660681 [Cadophora sp. DSE1049]|nr:hypothetical protein DL98DRAFT_660681 [Cadophora sp. DSE1049]
MEHLGIPDEHRSRGLTIPYLGIAPRYDGQGLIGFPERHGLHSEDLANYCGRSFLPRENTDPLPFSPDFIESFFQEWLWFGMLDEFALACGLPLDLSTFIKTGTDGQRIASTEFLLPYVRSVAIDQLIQRDVPHDLDVGNSVQIEERYSPSAIRSCYDPSSEDVSLQSLISLIMESEAYRKPQPKDRFSRFENCLREVRRTMRPALLYVDTIHRLEIAFSVDILCDNLMYVILNIFKESMDVKASFFEYYMSRFGDRMKAGNWCPARAKSVLPFDTVAIYFKSVLPSYASTPHMDCGSIFCSRQSHDVNSLHAQHDLNTCDGKCQVLAVDEQKVIDILESSGIPGIQCIEKEDRTFDLEVADITGGDYIAISHVWSHGLGNPNQNALPMCQIKRLFRYIQNIGSPYVFLWIDTLSVPVNLKYKRIAITKLRSIYQKAYGVLVIDRHLIRVGRNVLERKIQLLCSEWMRRLWTLQEGRLATRLYVQFRHEAVSVEELCDIDEVPADNFVFGDISRPASLAIRLHFAHQDHLTRRFMDLTIDMAHRSVTVPTDEPICLATMLGLPLEQYKPYPTMVDIYRSLPVLPPDLLFLENPKMTAPGFRWAPSTFLNQDAQDFHDSPDADSALLMDEGLRITRSCIIFKNDLQFSDLSQDYLVRDGLDITFLYYDNQGMRGGFYANAAIILNHTGSRFRSYIRAVLVDNLVLSNGIYYCRFQRHLMVRKWNGLAEEGDELDTGTEDRYTFDGEFQQEETFCVD